MPTIKQQIDLEDSYLKRSASRYLLKQDMLAAGGKNDQRDAIRFSIQNGIIEAAETLRAEVTKNTAGVNNKYNAVVRKLAVKMTTQGKIQDYEALIFIALSVTFQAVSNKKPLPLTALKMKIAGLLETEAKAQLFAALHPGYFYTIMQSMQDQGVQQLQHVHKVVMTKFKHLNIEWQPWSYQEMNAVAHKILNSILLSIPDVLFLNYRKSLNKTVYFIDTTVEADEWFGDFELSRSLMRPSLPPAIRPPIPWYISESGDISGGYYTQRLNSALPFIKTRTKEHQAFIADNPPNTHITAINKMQATAWEVNSEVLAIQQKIFKSKLGGVGIPRITQLPLPPFPAHLKTIKKEHLTDKAKQEIADWKQAAKITYTRNRLNKSKVLTYKFTLDAAIEYNNFPEFYFLYNCDFRGRIYCATVGLSPQGDDTAKSLLRFANPVIMGQTGLNWLAVHIANTYGNDKVSISERINWTKKNEEKFKAIASSPDTTTHLWKDADKPWQFLAAVLEWSKSNYGRNPDAAGHLPIGLDGSCNGIQHYSALLRDIIGGTGVNLRDSETPSDIYNDVARETSRLLAKRESSALKTLWTRAGIDRKLAKRPVMTLPYGSSQSSAKDYVYEWLLNNPDKMPIPSKDLYSAAVYLTPILWEAIGNIIIASRAAMSWIQKQAYKIAKKSGKPIKWRSPAGFPVYQSYFKQDTVQVNTTLLGSITVRKRMRSNILIDSKELHLTKQKSGIAPNFIHSIDASHMVNTIVNTDLDAYAMIHDDYGTHAGNTQALWIAIRKEFYNLYSNHSPLKDWYDQQSDEPIDFPETGSLNIADVLTSTYFFT